MPIRSGAAGVPLGGGGWGRSGGCRGDGVGWAVGHRLRGHCSAAHRASHGRRTPDTGRPRTPGGRRRERGVGGSPVPRTRGCPCDGVSVVPRCRPVCLAPALLQRSREAAASRTHSLMEQGTAEEEEVVSEDSADFMSEGRCCASRLGRWRWPRARGRCGGGYAPPPPLVPDALGGGDAAMH